MQNQVSDIIRKYVCKYVNVNMYIGISVNTNELCFEFVIVWAQ